MITEDYVSFETAKLLKEKGFDCACKVWYAEYASVWGGDPSGDRKYINIQFDDENMVNDSYKFLCYAPTLQMAIKWLRKNHNLAISASVTVDGWRSYVSQIKLDSEGFVVDIIDGIDDGNIPNCNTYEQACEAAIKYCLENLI